MVWRRGSASRCLGPSSSTTRTFVSCPWRLPRAIWSKAKNTRRQMPTATDERPMSSAVKIFDEVLPESQFNALHAFVRDSQKRQSIYGVGIWQNNQENPVEGEQTFFWSARP